jgi:hypothetical protein
MNGISLVALIPFHCSTISTLLTGLSLCQGSLEERFNDKINLGPCFNENNYPNFFFFSDILIVNHETISTFSKLCCLICKIQEKCRHYDCLKVVGGSSDICQNPWGSMLLGQNLKGVEYPYFWVFFFITCHIPLPPSPPPVCIYDVV